jgi:hypothetical protein
VSWRDQGGYYKAIKAVEHGQTIHLGAMGEAGFQNAINFTIYKIQTGSKISET